MTERFSRVFFRSLALGLFMAFVLLLAPDARACGPFCDMPGDSNGKGSWVDNAVACESLCDRTNGCRGWTWVKPGLAGPQGVCWLKSQLMPAVRSDCCISGFRGDRTAANSVRQFNMEIPGQRPAPPAPGGQVGQGTPDMRPDCDCRDERGRAYHVIFGQGCDTAYDSLMRLYEPGCRR
jgi:hypothetical protein